MTSFMVSRQTHIPHARHIAAIEGRSMELHQYQLYPSPSPTSINIGLRKKLSGSRDHTSDFVSRKHNDYPQSQGQKNKIRFSIVENGGNHTESSSVDTTEGDDDIDTIVRDILDAVSRLGGENMVPSQEAASETNTEVVLEDCKSISLEDNVDGENIVGLRPKNNEEQKHFVLSSTDSDDTIDPKKYRRIFSHKVWNGSSGKWFPTKHYWIRNLVEDKRDDQKGKHFRIALSRGGQLHLFPSLLDPKKVHEVKDELLQSKLWRKYCIQGGDEPRLHFLVRVTCVCGSMRMINISTSGLISFLRSTTCSFSASRECNRRVRSQPAAGVQIC